MSILCRYFGKLSLPQQEAGLSAKPHPAPPAQLEDCANIMQIPESLRERSSAAPSHAAAGKGVSVAGVGAPPPPWMALGQHSRGSLWHQWGTPHMGNMD